MRILQNLFTYCLLLDSDLFSSDVRGIRNGLPALIGMYPFTVAIWRYGDLGCTGVIINDRHVTTSGHCVKRFSPADLRVVAGVSSFDHGSVTWLLVTRVTVHPEYEVVPHPMAPQSNFIAHDIAVLRVSP